MHLLPNRAAILACCWLVAGCVGAPPTAEEMAEATYGPEPSDHEARVRQVVLAAYRSEQVVEVEVGAPRKAWFGDLGGTFRARNIQFGWVVRFRGYRLSFAGVKPAVVGEVFFRADDLVAIADGRDGLRSVTQPR
ncbi:MAG: hypothetical protein ACO4CZ_01325 [Planctomycetota bacterium]|jgi:hypothetical protein